MNVLMRRVSHYFVLASLSSVALAAEPTRNVKAPAGWNVTLFATPPDVGYPTCLSTSPNGDLYVGIDENGSIDAKPNRGRVVRCSDLDGDGKADRFVTFATMDSPRGIWFENNVLYVQHPPLVEAFIDDDGDGKADRSEILVRGLGFDLKFRGADHTINGMRMGIDGFLYIACGDYGATNAVGKDGTRIQLHGGGVVRVRPDGTGLEIVSRGQRNIYDVAVSPELDLFTRDNTNDGDGWDVRLSHVVMGGNYGYPTLFKNFSDEIIQPLADYGGGSPCGALFMDEPGFPQGFGRGLYTVEWGRGGIFRHPLTPNGASFKATQEKFIELQRPTDFDVDGSGRLYISSWQGATFTYNGPNAGFIARVTPPGWAMKPFAAVKSASDADLLKLIASPSAFARVYAQREVLRRGRKASLGRQLEKLALTNRSPAVRVAAIFTLRQLGGPESISAMLRLAEQNELREPALRALADDLREKSFVPAQPFVNAFSDGNPRVRLQAVTALGRLGRMETAYAILPLVTDTDPVVAHVAVNTLIALRASDVCLAAFDSPGSVRFQAGAARVLQALHEPAVVEGIMTRLSQAKDPASWRLLAAALARLCNREDDWNGRWWGTRPDTTGPYFKPARWSKSERIENLFRSMLTTAEPESLSFLAMTLQKNRVEIPELVPAILKLADEDSKFRANAVDLFASRKAIPAEAIEWLGKLATSRNEEASMRVKAIRCLAKAEKNAALDAAVAALTQPGEAPHAITSAWEDFARDTKHSRNVNYFTRLIESGTAEKRLLAYAVLANVASAKVSDRNGKVAAASAIDAAWTNAVNATSLLQAISRLKLEPYAAQVRGLLNDPRTEVAAAAKSAAQGLKLDLPESAGTKVEQMNFAEVMTAMNQAKGDARAGADLFTKLGCVACHTTSAAEVPKGPFLGGIGTRYSRAELCESVVKPNAKIAQGFETQWFQTKDGEEIEGFVTREGGDDLDLRNVAGITTTLMKKDIVQRARRDKSVMPEGLADKLTAPELASLLAYLESLKAK